MHRPGSPTVLRIDASARHVGSTSRQLTDDLAEALRKHHDRPAARTGHSCSKTHRPTMA